jgi:hypothetical protein
MRWYVVAIATFALALAAVGCGGGNSESSATTDTATLSEGTTTEGSTTDETTTAESTTTQATTDLSGVLGSKQCLQLAAAIASIGQAFATPGSGGDASGFFGKFNPPDAIKADVQTLAKWYQAYFAALQKAGFKAGQTPTPQQLQSYQAALAGLDQAGVSAASQRIGTWAQTNCHS